MTFIPSLSGATTGGRELPSTERHRVYENGTLIISDANRDLDEGVYVCKALNEKGEAHSRNLFLQVLSKCVFFKNKNPGTRDEGNCVLEEP